MFNISPANVNNKPLSFRKNEKSNMQESFKGASDKFYSKLPTIALSDKAEKKVNTLFGNVDGWMQRLIMGATAIVTQPFIDYNNKRVDKDTRKYSTIKTVAKIVVGTTVGVAVRLGTLKFSEKVLVKGPKELYMGSKKFSELSKDALNNLNEKIHDPNSFEKGPLWPLGNEEGDIIKKQRIKTAQKKDKNADVSEIPKSTASDVRSYVSQIGTATGVLVSLVTNFVIDAPLTKFFTNYYADKYGLSNPKKEAK